MTHESQGEPRTLNYDTPTRTSGLAVAAMVLGIVSIPLSCALVGVVPAVGALVMGAIAYSRIKREPWRYGGKGYANVGMWTGVVSLALVPAVAVVLPGLIDPPRRPAWRSMCQANIAGILKAAVVYANDNGDRFPVVGPPAVSGTYTVDLGINSGRTKVEDAIEVGRTRAAGNAMANLWVLVINGMVSPKSFQCRSDPWAASSASPSQDGRGSWLLTPREATQISYSAAYPWTATGGVGAWWTNNTDASIPLLADMAPLEGTGSPRRALTADSTSNKVLNSGNHNGDGQNVGFGDAHAEWCRKPNVGQNGDNVYTSGATPANGWGTGQNPSALMLTSNPYDILLVPLRNLDSGALR